MLSWVEHEKSFNCWYYYFYDQVKFHAQLSWAWKRFYNLGTGSFLHVSVLTLALLASPLARSCQYLCVYNIKANIPYCWRPIPISIFWHRRCPGQWKFASSISICVPQIINVFRRFQELWVFSLTITFWPRYCLGQVKSGSWQFLYLDLVNINVDTKFHQNIS